MKVKSSHTEILLQAKGLDSSHLYSQDDNLLQQLFLLTLIEQVTIPYEEKHTKPSSCSVSSY